MKTPLEELREEEALKRQEVCIEAGLLLGLAAEMKAKRMKEAGKIKHAEETYA